MKNRSLYLLLLACVLLSACATPPPIERVDPGLIKMRSDSAATNTVTFQKQ